MESSSTLFIILCMSIVYGVMWLGFDRPRLRAVQFVGNAAAEEQIKRSLVWVYAIPAASFGGYLLFSEGLAAAFASVLMVGAYFLETRIIAASTPILCSNAKSPLVDGVSAGLWKGRLFLAAALFQAVGDVSKLFLPQEISLIVSLIASMVAGPLALVGFFPLIRYWIAIQKHAKALGV